MEAQVESLMVLHTQREVRYEIGYIKKMCTWFL